MGAHMIPRADATREVREVLDAVRRIVRTLARLIDAVERLPTSRRRMLARSRARAARPVSVRVQLRSPLIAAIGLAGATASSRRGVVVAARTQLRPAAFAA